MSARGRIALLAGVALFALDFYLDTRERDVLSWMDEYQYYEFARDVAQGRERFDGFEIPSVFPLFTAPLLIFDASIATALWINGVGALILLVGLRELSRELGVRTSLPWLALLVVTSPVLVGLARTMYVEFTLTALNAVVFALWLRVQRSRERKDVLVFGVALALAFMTKTTFAVFLLAPVAGAVAVEIVKGRVRDAVLLGLAFAVPIGLAVSIHITWFAPSIGYYLNLVSTSLPFMYLMGPPEIGSIASITYYFRELFASYLFALTPVFVFVVAASVRPQCGRTGPDRRSGLDEPDRSRGLSSRTALWLWLLSPLVLLIAHPLKEPRHAAPSVVPAVLILVLAIEALPRARLRAASLGVASLLAVGQYAAVTRGSVEAPYFLDRSLRVADIDAAMRAGTPVPPSTEVAADSHARRFGLNVALAGFPANEALALVWQGFPGVVYDLDNWEDGQRSDVIPYREFEDLFFLAGINTYNRRCGWHRYYETLTRPEIIDNADFIITHEIDSEIARARFAGHVEVARVTLDGGDVRVLRASRATTPYRSLYARHFLRRNVDLPAAEMRTIAEELLITEVLRGHRERAAALMREFPVLRDPRLTARNIYWIGGYPALLDLTRRRIEAMNGDISR